MPNWRDLRKFCERDKWELYKDTDHYFYRKFENGEVTRVKVSKGSGEIHGHLWQEILKKQLKVSLEYFRACLKSHKKAKTINKKIEKAERE